MMRMNGKVNESLVAARTVYSPVFLDARGRERGPTREEERAIKATRDKDKSIRFVCEQCANVPAELVEGVESLKVYEP